MAENKYQYSYQYPHPAVTTDCVVFGYDVAPENWEANSILSDDWEHLDPMDKLKTDDSDVDYESNSLIYENEKSILENSTKLQEPNYNILSDNEKYKYKNIIYIFE